MKIGVVGCGALGSYYAARLSQSGRQVHCLLRSDYEAVRQHGIRVRSVDGDFVARPACARRPEEIGQCDVVLIGLKTTANDQYARLLPPLVGTTTGIVTLQNGLGNEEQLARLFPASQVLGGLCFVCLNRIEPGVIRHSAYGLIVLGELSGPSRPRTRALAEMLRQAAVPCQITEDLRRSRWEKLVWNVPFNGLGVAGAAGYEAITEGILPTSSPRRVSLPTDQLLDGDRWEGLVRELMEEVLCGASAVGCPIPAEVIDEQIHRTRTMGAYKASTLLDFEHGQPLEWESLFQEPLRQAEAAGVMLPRLAALCRVIAWLESTRAAEFDT